MEEYENDICIPLFRTGHQNKLNITDKNAKN